MISRPGRLESLLAALTGVATVAASYVTTGWSPTFVVAPVDQQIVHWTPGATVTFMIENVGEAGHLIHVGMAIATMIGVFALLSPAGVRLAAHLGLPIVGGIGATPSNRAAVTTSSSG